MFQIGQILIRKCATRSSVETNENSIVTSQWKSTVTSLIACLPQHVYVVVQHHVGEEGKPMTWSYVCIYRKTVYEFILQYLISCIYECILWCLANCIYVSRQLLALNYQNQTVCLYPKVLTHWELFAELWRNLSFLRDFTFIMNRSSWIPIFTY